MQSVKRLNVKHTYIHIGLFEIIVRSFRVLIHEKINTFCSENVKETLNRLLFFFKCHDIKIKDLELHFNFISDTISLPAIHVC